jgi:predicted GIY-YIG superfamily endonuclease
MSQALYRFFDAADVLLYVGITSHLPGRMSQHEGEKPWWDEVKRVSVERFATREEVADAEIAAIRTEGPKYNISHNPRAARRPRATERRVALATAGEGLNRVVEGRTLHEIDLQLWASAPRWLPTRTQIAALDAYERGRHQAVEDEAGYPGDPRRHPAGLPGALTR